MGSHQRARVVVGQQPGAPGAHKSAVRLHGCRRRGLLPRVELDVDAVKAVHAAEALDEVALGHRHGGKEGERLPELRGDRGLDVRDDGECHGQLAAVCQWVQRRNACHAERGAEADERATPEIIVGTVAVVVACGRLACMVHLQHHVQALFLFVHQGQKVVDGG